MVNFDDWVGKDKQIDKHYDMIEDWEVFEYMGCFPELAHKISTITQYDNEGFFAEKYEMAYDRAREEYEEGGYKG